MRVHDVFRLPLGMASVRSWTAAKSLVVVRAHSIAIGAERQDETAVSPPLTKNRRLQLWRLAPDSSMLPQPCDEKRENIFPIILVAGPRTIFHSKPSDVRRKNSAGHRD